MSSERISGLHLEIAHVLFMDVVGFSQLLINDQTEVLNQLNHVVRSTAHFREAEAAGKLVRLATGDGMALVFSSSAEAPVECAIEIGQALQNHPQIQLRMGVHTGPVNAVSDVNDRSNVTGAGINMAQRVMDCGDAGHILLSQRVADDLAQYREWSESLHDLGECEAKHGVKVHIFNFVGERFGNPRPPAKLALGSGSQSPRYHWPWFAAGLLVLTATVLVASYFIRNRNASTPMGNGNISAIPRKSIAVLPFENLSHDPENAYFADGIQEEILTRLSKIADLKVISRTSTARYKSAPPNLREIANELGVANVLEGSVQRSTEQVRVNVQLIKAENDSHLWADTYDRKLSDIFAVESEVARNIADSLRANLSLEEKERVEKKPTSNPAAYDLYLQARSFHNRGLANIVRQDFDNARRLYQAALGEDPQFALAHAQLSATLGAIFHWFEPTESVRDFARSEAEEALRLEPSLAEAHLSLGLCLYWTERKYDEALAEFAITARTLPNSVEVFTDIAAIRRRQGNWQEATSGFQHALDLDPRNPSTASEMAFTLMFQRRWEAASKVAHSAIALGPDLLNLAIRAAYIDFYWKDDTSALRTLLGSIPAENDPDGIVTRARWDLAMLERDFAAAKRAIDACKLDIIIPYGTPLPKSYLRGCVELAQGNSAAAQPFLENARQYLEAQVQAIPDDPSRLASMALVYSYLGRHDEALRSARKAVELLPESRDAIVGPGNEATLSLVSARAGNGDAAINLISRLLTRPSGIIAEESNMTVPDLRRRWQWDPLRNDPRFQQIIAQGDPKTHPN